MLFAIFGKIMDRLEAMEMLLEVVDLGSFSAAGRKLGVPVSTVSRKISDLEDTLGARLLVRTTRRLALTDTGMNYAEAARRILEQVEEAEREAAGEFSIPKGELTITAPIMFGRLHVLPVVSEFLKLFPQIDIRLLLSDRNVHLVEDHVDMATRIGSLPDSGLVATRLGRMRTVVCASPMLLARHARPRRPEDLRALPCVTFDTPLPSPNWQFREPGSGAVIQVGIKPRLAVTSSDATLAAALDCAGVARLLHYQAAEALAEGRLEILLEEFEPEPAPVHILHAARGQMPLKLRRFLDFATPKLRARLERLSSGG